MELIDAVFHVIGDGDGSGEAGRGVVWVGEEEEMSQQEVAGLREAPGLSRGGLCYEAFADETPDVVARR